jgi:hypothetical protein
MSLHTFEHDFTKDLESFVKKDAEWIFPLKTWAPRKIAAPERHRILGQEASVSVQTQIHLLDTQNPAFELMESMLRLYMNPVEYSQLSGIIDFDKEQVWLFAIRWLTHYYECLMEPLVIRTEFYKQSHAKFLALMRSMLQYSPGRRISFEEAHNIWTPKTEESLGSDSQETQTHVVEPPRTEEPVVPVQEQSSKNAAPLVEAHPDAHHSPHPSLGVQPFGPYPVVSGSQPVAQPVAQSVGAVQPSLLQQPLRAARSGTGPSEGGARSRLVLKRSVDHAERNKTRKSLRNSNCFPANGSSAKQT